MIRSSPREGAYKSFKFDCTLIMSCFMSEEEREQLRISRDIQKRIDAHKRCLDNELKLLLLG